MLFQKFKKIIKEQTKCRMRVIITRSLYMLNPLFEGQKRLFKVIFSQNSAPMHGSNLRAVSKQDQVLMACVR